MESLGQYLRERRTQRGMSMEELAARTRIGVHTLRALEADDYPALPVEVTVKGFLRSYARCLGLDEQDVLARYQQYAAEYFHIANDANPMGRVEQTIAPYPLWRHRMTLVGLTIAGLVVAISVIVAVGPRGDSDHPTSMAIPPPVTPSPFTEPVPAESMSEPVPSVPEAPLPSQSAPVVPPPPAPLPAPKPIDSVGAQQVTIAATETSWVQVVIDGGEPREALLQPGETITWSGDREFRLTVGNAGGVSVVFNGEPVPALGASGRVRTLVLPRVAMNTPRPDEPAQAPAPALTSPPESITVPSQPPQ